MLLIGVDYHPSFQQIAFLNQDSGECGELRLNHGDGEAERFYRELQQRGIRVRVGMEATRFARTPSRFARGKQIGTYAGMIPSEESSGNKHIRSR